MKLMFHLCLEDEGKVKADRNRKRIFLVLAVDDGSSARVIPLNLEYVRS